MNEIESKSGGYLHSIGHLSTRTPMGSCNFIATALQIKPKGYFHVAKNFPLGKRNFKIRRELI